MSLLHEFELYYCSFVHSLELALYMVNDILNGPSSNLGVILYLFQTCILSAICCNVIGFLKLIMV